MMEGMLGCHAGFVLVRHGGIRPLGTLCKDRYGADLPLEAVPAGYSDVVVGEWRVVLRVSARVTRRRARSYVPRVLACPSRDEKKKTEQPTEAVVFSWPAVACKPKEKCDEAS